MQMVTYLNDEKQTPVVNGSMCMLYAKGNQSAYKKNQSQTKRPFILLALPKAPATAAIIRRSARLPCTQLSKLTESEPVGKPKTDLLLRVKQG
jgi:hypothetical protein